MANTNTRTAEDKAKGMAYKFEVKSAYLNGSIRIQKTVIRDPGTKKELALPADIIDFSINMTGAYSTPEETAATLKQFPELAPIVASFLDALVKSHTFEA